MTLASRLTSQSTTIEYATCSFHDCPSFAYVPSSSSLVTGAETGMETLLYPCAVLFEDGIFLAFPSLSVASQYPSCTISWCVNIIVCMSRNHVHSVLIVVERAPLATCKESEAALDVQLHHLFL